MKITVFDIQRNSYVDGPGIRTTVFFKGCNLRCEWCHKPEGQSFEQEMLFYKDKCTGCGKCIEKCPTGGISDKAKCAFCGKCELYCPNDARRICGKEYDIDELMSELCKDRAFYEKSGGGLTCSGGECMLQTDALSELLSACKDQDLNTAVDTAGNVPWSSFEKVLPFADMFLYDIKAITPQLHKKYTGVGNELILDNLKRLFKAQKRIWIRVPVIGGVNDTSEEMKKIADFLRPYSPEKVELLPYHSMGEGKFKALGKTAAHFETPENINELREIFDSI